MWDTLTKNYTILRFTQKTKDAYNFVMSVTSILMSEHNSQRFYRLIVMKRTNRLFREPMKALH